MKIIGKMVLCATCVAVLCVGCQSTPAESAVSIDDAVVGLVPQLVQEALASPCFAGGKPPVMAVGHIKNDTMMIRGGSLDLMSSQMVEMFSNSGRVVFSSAFAGERNEKDSLANSGQIVAPSLVLHGKLTQRTSRRKDGGTQLEFSLALSIVDLASGSQLWGGSRSVCIAVDKNTPTW